MRDLPHMSRVHLRQRSHKRENRVQEVAEISRGIKARVRALNVPVSALSQLARAVEGLQSHVLILSDLREIGALEQNADIKEWYEPETIRKTLPNGPLPNIATIRAVSYPAL